MGVPLMVMSNLPIPKFLVDLRLLFQPTVSVTSATTRKLDKQHVLPKKELRLLTNLRLIPTNKQSYGLAD